MQILVWITIGIGAASMVVLCTVLAAIGYCEVHDLYVEHHGPDAEILQFPTRDHLDGAA